MQNKISYGIHAKIVDQIIGINDVALGFTHLAFPNEKPWMTKYLLRQRYVQSHQHDRPIYRMETDNILTNQMQICRPVFFHHRIIIAIQIIAQTCQVIA